MSRCASKSAALTLVIACPQPRGSKFHRIVQLKKAVYGWSQVISVGKFLKEGFCTYQGYWHKTIVSHQGMPQVYICCAEVVNTWPSVILTESPPSFPEQMEGSICQYVEGDCTLRYEFVHRQIMRPTTPQNFREWRALGPQFFCNPWDGNGREDWVRNRVVFGKTRRMKGVCYLSS